MSSSSKNDSDNRSQNGGQRGRRGWNSGSKPWWNKNNNYRSNNNYGGNRRNRNNNDFIDANNIIEALAKRRDEKLASLALERIEDMVDKSALTLNTNSTLTPSFLNPTSSLAATIVSQTTTANSNSNSTTATSSESSNPQLHVYAPACVASPAATSTTTTTTNENKLLEELTIMRMEMQKLQQQAFSTYHPHRDPHHIHHDPSHSLTSSHRRHDHRLHFHSAPCNSPLLVFIRQVPLQLAMVLLLLLVFIPIMPSMRIICQLKNCITPLFMCMNTNYRN